MLKNHFHPVFQVSMALKKSLFQVQMSNYTVLKTPYWNITDRDLITRVESSQISQTFAVFSIPYLNSKTGGARRNARRWCAIRQLLDSY